MGNQTRRERAGTGRTAVPSRAAGSGARAVHATPPGRGGAERGGRTKPRCQRAGGRKEKRRWWRRGAQQVSPVPGPARALRRAAPCHAGNGRSRAEPCGAVRSGAGAALCAAGPGITGPLGHGGAVGPAGAGSAAGAVYGVRRHRRPRSTWWRGARGRPRLSAVGRGKCDSLRDSRLAAPNPLGSAGTPVAAGLRASGASISASLVLNGVCR